MSDYGIIILIIYLVSLFALYIYKYVNIYLAKFIAYSISFFAFIIAGLRPDHFPDVDTYELMFNFASDGDFDNPLYWVSHGEPGFKIFSFVLSEIGFTYRSFLLIISFSSYLFFIIASRVANVQFVYVWFFYLSTFFITRDLGVIRLSIASHLIVIALSQKNILSSLFTLVISSFSFQYYSLVAFFSSIFAKINFNFLSIFFFVLCSFFIIFFFDPNLLFSFALEKQLDNYDLASSSTAESSSPLVPILRNSIFLLFVYFLYRGIKIEFTQKVWMISLLLSVISYITLSNYLIVAQRFSAYFGAVLPFAIAWILVNNKHFNKINFHASIVFFILNFLSLFYFNDFIWIEKI